MKLSCSEFFQVVAGGSAWLVPSGFAQKIQLAVADTARPETCNVYNMLKLTRQLFALQPDIRYAEFHERALFDHILTSVAKFIDMHYRVPAPLTTGRKTITVRFVATGGNEIAPVFAIRTIRG